LVVAQLGSDDITYLVYDLTRPRRVALYLRVSTDGQTVENQRRELEAVAQRHGWQIVHVFADEGISGAKGRDKRPALDAMLKCVARREFDLVAAWSVDRLGRSLRHLVEFLEELKAKGIDLYLHRQGLDTSTPTGKMMFQMLGVFSEFERAMIVDRVKAGMRRAKAQGKAIGRPMVGWEIEERIRSELVLGKGIHRVARTVGVGSGTVQRVKAEMRRRAAEAGGETVRVSA
jgi:DNA invertase Pin-like site-specific DNA recombinase